MQAAHLNSSAAISMRYIEPHPPLVSSTRTAWAPGILDRRSSAISSSRCAEVSPADVVDMRDAVLHHAA